MNIQIPFELLGQYESIVLNTDDIESYNFRYNFTNPNMDNIERVKEVLPKLIEYFEKLGHKDAYGMRERWKI